MVKYLLSYVLFLCMGAFGIGCGHQAISLTPSSSDGDLAAAAAAVREKHPEGGEAMWRSLAALIRPKMNVRQMLVVLPRSSAPMLTVWNGNTFFLQYPLDNDFGVEASGIGIGSGEGHEQMVLTSSPRIICFRDPTTDSRENLPSGPVTTSSRPANE